VGEPILSRPVGWRRSAAPQRAGNRTLTLTHTASCILCRTSGIHSPLGRSTAPPPTLLLLCVLRPRRLLLLLLLVDALLRVLRVAAVPRLRVRGVPLRLAASRGSGGWSELVRRAGGSLSEREWSCASWQLAGSWWHLERSTRMPCLGTPGTRR
jgi:hypothetical protein